jgi:hypothetical protein
MTRTVFSVGDEVRPVGEAAAYKVPTGEGPAAMLEAQLQAGRFGIVLAVNADGSRVRVKRYLDRHPQVWHGKDWVPTGRRRRVPAYYGPRQEK